jgi:hypothetical protein
MDAGSTLTINGWNDEKEYFYATNFTGALPNATGGPPENQIYFTGPYSDTTGTTTKWLSWGQHEITPVPEPATYGALFTAATLGLFFWFRSKANARRPVPVRVAVRS